MSGAFKHWFPEFQRTVKSVGAAIGSVRHRTNPFKKRGMLELEVSGSNDLRVA